jgi:hypothetical protein
MSAWTWVLVALCILGAALALGSFIPVVLAALRVRTKMKDLKRSPLFLSLESLRIQQNRLSRIAAETAPLQKRAQAAIASMDESTRTSGLPESRAALEEAGANLHALYEELR